MVLHGHVFRTIQYIKLRIRIRSAHSDPCFGTIKARPVLTDIHSEQSPYSGYQMYSFRGYDTDIRRTDMGVAVVTFDVDRLRGRATLALVSWSPWPRPDRRRPCAPVHSQQAPEKQKIIMWMIISINHAYDKRKNKSKKCIPNDDNYLKKNLCN